MRLGVHGLQALDRDVRVDLRRRQLRVPQGVKPVRETLPPKTARLLKRLRRVEELPPADQRAVLKLVDAMLDTRRRSTPPSRAKRKAS